MTGPAQDATGAAAAANGDAEVFYAESLRLLRDSGIPFLVAGTYALAAYTGIQRRTKDIDVFCKAGDYPRILAYFQQRGYRTAVEDERWIAKVYRDPHVFDVIFGASATVVPISDAWFAEHHAATVLGSEVRLVPPTELVWSKVFVQNRERYDGADVAHLILKQHDKIDWRRLLSYMEQYWEVLLIHVLNFRFIYPSERDRVPRWLVDELTTRVREHADLPLPRVKVCRGRLFSAADYAVDIAEWGFADVVGHEGQAADDRG